MKLEEAIPNRVDLTKRANIVVSKGIRKPSVLRKILRKHQSGERRNMQKPSWPHHALMSH